jgi:tRNA A-37 threonylcarbamoyl transferase component Bud32
MRLTPGTRVGPYEVVSLLGAGGMAEVYRAKDTRLGRDVAVKVMSEALGMDRALRERFEREAKLAGSLNHPNIVALYDVGFEDGKPYFVTELLQGESLRDRLSKGPLPLAQTLEWSAQMAQALAAAHERGIAHRDLKPENVLITKDGPVKLIDFGIAKLVEEAREASPHGLMEETASPSGRNTGTGMVLGTPGYMSPEQVRGDAVDARTDLFSFGVVLYEMLGGRRAFAAGSVVESGYAILHAEPEPLPETTPPPVTQLVRRCLEKDAGRRFQSARDLAFYLEVLRTPTGASVPVEAVPALPAPVSRRRRWLERVGVLTAAVLAAGGVAYFVGRDSRPPMPSVERITFRRGRVTAARFNPEGRVVFSAAWEGQPLELFARASGSPEAQSLGLRDAALLAVSSKGDLAVLVRPEWYGHGLRGALAVVPAAGGAPREVTENVLAADWSPAGELAVVREVGGKRQLEYPLGKIIFETAESIFHARVSPTGAEVAFISGPRLMVADRKGTVRVLAAAWVSGLAWSPGTDEVWFSGDANVLRAIARTGGNPRLVYQGVAEMELEDISPAGHALVDSGDASLDVAFVPSEKQRERRLSSLSSYLVALSDDGRQALFTTDSPDVDGPPSIYLCPTDGSPAVRLGMGIALALSPDEKWVLSQSIDASGYLALLPVGIGVARKVAVGELRVVAAQFFRDGKRLVFTGMGADKRFRLYVAPLEDGAPTAISDDSVVPYLLEISADGRFVAAVNSTGVLTLYPTGGGLPVPLPELGADALPVRWTPEGELWVRPNPLREIPGRLVRYDIPNRRVQEERSVTLADTTGVMAFFQVRMAAEGRGLAVNYERSLGELFLLSGLAAPHR